MRRWSLVFACVAMLACHAFASPPEARVKRLARGVNIPHWF